MPVKSREIHLNAYPQGAPTEEIFETAAVEIADPKEGQALMRTVWMSVDPYMRGRMTPGIKSYIPPFELGKVLDGGAVAQVVAGGTKDLKVGDYVVGFTGGWREHWLTDGEGLTKVDPNLAPLSAYLGVLGMPGFTAWAGIENILKPKEGETMFVSGAAGAVGSLVGQIGKMRGCTVIGTAGSDEKCAWLTDELGFDVALNYKNYETSNDLAKELYKHAPKGIDTYFENVGGIMLEAAISAIAFGGRIALCGLISVYNNQRLSPGPNNMANLVGRGVLMRGFIMSEYIDQMPKFFAEIAPAVASGKVKFKETVYEGLDQAPEAFAGLFRGDNTGKAVIRVSPDTV